MDRELITSMFNVGFSVCLLVILSSAAVHAGQRDLVVIHDDRDTSGNYSNTMKAMADLGLDTLQQINSIYVTTLIYPMSFVRDFAGDSGEYTVKGHIALKYIAPLDTSKGCYCLFTDATDYRILGYIKMDSRNRDEPVWADNTNSLFTIEAGLADCHNQMTVFGTDTLPIVCRWKNRCDRPVYAFGEFKDTANYPTDAPAGICVRIIGENRRTLTWDDDNAASGWWPRPIPLLPMTFPIIDAILVEPDAEVSREIDLKTVLEDCPMFPDGLMPGEYTIQLRFNGCYSNELSIEIAE